MTARVRGGRTVGAGQRIKLARQPSRHESMGVKQSSYLDLIAAVAGTSRRARWRKTRMRVDAVRHWVPSSAAVQHPTSAGCTHLPAADWIGGITALHTPYRRRVLRSYSP